MISFWPKNFISFYKFIVVTDTALIFRAQNSPENYGYNFQAPESAPEDTTNSVLNGLLGWVTLGDQLNYSGPSWFHQ